MMENKVRLKSRTHGEKPAKRSIPICVLIGLLTAVLLFVTLLFTLSAIALRNDDPDALCKAFGYLTVALSLFGGGLAAAIASPSDKLASSALCGVILTLIAAALRIIVGAGSDCKNLNLVFFAFPLISISAAFASELAGKSMKKNKKRKTKFERK